MVKKVTGIGLMLRKTGRRTGDPAGLVADSSKIKQKLNCNPKYDDLQYLIKTAWKWERKIA